MSCNTMVFPLLYSSKVDRPYMSGSVILEKYKEMTKILTGAIIPIITESLRLLPDSLVLGTSMLAMLSLSQSYGVLVMTMIELMLFQRLAANIFASVQSLGAGSNVLESICQPGFMFPNSMRISLLEHIGIPSSFPSPVMFFLTGVITYIISSVREFSNEITTLGGDLQTRTIAALVLSSFLIIAMFAFRIAYGCETFGPLFLSVLLGAIGGVALMNQNIILFGRVGINILNLPMILTPSESGKSSMYVCGPAS